VPITEVLSAAWDILPAFPKRLIWLAGRDYQRLAVRFRNDPSVRILKEDWQIDRLLVASDVLISKANRMTVYEAASLGLPSISISNLANWPDDVAVANVESDTALRADSITPQELAELMIAKKNSKPAPAVQASNGIAGAAARISIHIDRLCSRSWSAGK
jgi:UDP-N-acetylglucosamine:LPS N-acetylglucosamine transferase